MNLSYEAVKITDNVYWVGAIDWAVRDFHGYLTQRGTTYNAYLIMADKITLIDTVKRPFFDEMRARIAAVVNPEKIDYIVSNHSEMDHSGALPEALKCFKPEKLFASVMGAKALQAHFRVGELVSPLKTGDSVSLGNMNLNFVETKMLHWPDSMITHLDADGLLFSQDALGMHLAGSERFADQYPDWILAHEARKYFANILTPFSKLVVNLLDAIPGLGLEIKMIAPDHGPIWRNDLGKIIGMYRGFAEQRPEERAVVLYDTMWGSTAKMAEMIAEGVVSGGCSAKVFNLRSNHRSDVITELLGAGAVLIGSPTINNNIFPAVADHLTYIKGLKPAVPYGAAFGSYGWSGEAVKLINSVFEEMKISIVNPGIRSLYVPDKNVLDDCKALGVAVAEKIKA